MILTIPLRPAFAAFRRHGTAASPAGTASVPEGAAASARVAAAEDLCEPAPERGWFESSRELRAGLVVIELAGPCAAAALQ